MVYLVISSVILVAAVLVIVIRKKMVASVMATFLANYQLRLKSEGNPRNALKSTIEFFRYRYPFNQLEDLDVRNLVEVMSDTSNPQEVCAYLFQRLENEPLKMMPVLRNKTAMMRWVSIEDMTAGLINIMEQGKARTSSDRIMEGIVLSLAKRPGWMPKSQESDGILFTYNGTDVLLETITSGMKIARLILYTEVSFRARNPQNALDRYLQADVVPNFDDYFEASVQGMTRK